MGFMNKVELKEAIQKTLFFPPSDGLSIVHTR